jgi:hypothetical protein
MITSIAQLNAILEAGVVFDWKHPVLVGFIKRHMMGTFYASSRSQGTVAIWKDGVPLPKPANFKFAGHEVFELSTGEGPHGEGDVWNCFEEQSTHPDWNEDTYFPEEK